MEEDRFDCVCESIDSISDYIAVIEKNNLFNCISRGESRKYKDPLNSGIFRNCYFQKYTKLLDRFHLDVETSISASQEKHFLAFAQHHGIPTNLLDFSLSPLVSLYFAMDGCNDEGYIYFINKDKLVSINKQIISYRPGWGMLSEFLNLDPALMKELLPLLSDAYIKNREYLINYFQNHVECFIGTYKRNRSPSYLDVRNGVESLEKALQRFRNDKEIWIKEQDELPGLQIYHSFTYLMQGMRDVYKDEISYPKIFWENLSSLSSTYMEDAEYVANIYLLMMLFKLEEIEQRESLLRKLVSSETVLKSPVYELELPFYFSYRPPVIDDRVRNQFSIFVFQTFSANQYKFQNQSILVKQTIHPDFVIKAHNPSKIRSELTALGYTLKHIYCDYDSIARFTRDSINLL